MRALAAAIVLAMISPVAAQAKTWGLVIGIDEYENVPDLQGAVNDARDIADALDGLGADVTLLLNEAASRQAILDAWEGIAEQVQPGDRLVISYAGHGSYEPEHVVGSEEDGRDENFLLSGFSFRGPGAGERIRDDEVAALIALTPQAEVVFVADSCHSGTVSRNVNPVLGYRYVIGGQLADDPLPPPPPRSSASEGKDDVALFLAAVDDSEKVPEFLIDGEARGALSFSFARGLRGAADANDDGDMTQDEIASYVRKSVRSISQGLQAPRITPQVDELRVLFSLNDAPAPEPNPNLIITSPFEKAFAGLDLIQIAHNGASFGDSVLAGLEGVEVVTNTNRAEVFADFNAMELRSTVGDVLMLLDAADPSPGLSEALVKLRVTNALSDAIRPSLLEVRFAEGDRIYRRDDRVTVRITGRSTPYITLVAMAPDGAMALLYPVSTGDMNDPDVIDPSETLDLTLAVTPPFGADHIVAIETMEPPTDLRAVLAALDEQGEGSRKLWEVLRTAVLRLPSEPNIALFPFHTRR